MLLILACAMIKLLRSMKRYGLLAASEMEDWEIGPYCDEGSCHIPYGVTVGNNNTSVNVFLGS